MAAREGGGVKRERFECVAGIQARMSSHRLPGKVLADLGGKPLIQRVFERTRAATLVDQVVVLTSEDPSDDPLAEFLEHSGIPLRRGSLEDVRSRYAALLDEFDPRYVVRVTGDCPFVEPEFIDLQLGALRAFDADLVRVAEESAIEGTLGGQAALSARALRWTLASASRADREHVGSFFLKGHARECFRWVEIEVDGIFRWQGLRLAVDEPSDLEFARRIWAEVDQLGDGLFPLAQALRWLKSYPDVVRRINADVLESRDNRALRALSRPGGEEPAP